MQRLDKILSDAGVASRKELRGLIRTGRVQVNGVPALRPEEKFDEKTAELTIDGAPVEKLHTVLLMLHKPAGYVTSTDDPGGPSVLELIPERIPAVQVFGWEKQRRNCDRITANDGQIVALAVEFLRKAGVERSAIFWRDDIVRIPDHPRITRFLAEMNALGIETTEFRFGKYDTDFTGRLKQYIEAGSERIGFFGFNARCGVKLCCGLDSLGLLQKYSPTNVIVCDNSVLLRDFWPNPALIDLDLPLMAKRALEMLFWRMEQPGIPEAFVLQAPRPLQ